MAKTSPEDGSKQKGGLQLGVRPLELWEITFPEQVLPNILGMIAPENNSWDSSLTKYVKLLRRFMGWKEIPEYKPGFFPMRKDIEVLGLGIKEDRKNADGIEQI